VSETAQPAALPGFEPLSLLGATLDGRYELNAHLATGGMGAVFRARHVHLRKDVAVKVLRPDLSASADLVERFRREAEIASALEHENIVRVTDFGRTGDGWLFLVMELLTGESLFDRLRREGFLSPDEAVPILWQVCNGLEAAHALGVVHRDLKPENVFLARTTSGREVTKLLDFGIAKIAGPSSTSATAAGIVVGTPEYLAPEQALGAEVDARADLYAVGLIAWRALAGRHPFKAEDARSLLMMQATRPVPPHTEPRPDLAEYPALVAAVSKACAKETAARHQTAGALRDELRSALGPAFVLPPNGTPSPVLSLSTPSWSGSPSRMRSDGDTRAITSPGALPVGLEQWPALARIAAAAERVYLRAAERAHPARARVAGAARTSRAQLRAHPWIGLVLAVLVAAFAIAAGVAGWHRGRAAAEARAHLAGGQASKALALLDAALARRPGDHELVLLRARALHRIPGSEPAAVSAYGEALRSGPLDADAFADLARDLAAERSLADRAGRLLVEAGDGALPTLLLAAREGPGTKRLRALTLVRDLGAEERLDRTAAYGALLEDGDCDVRRAAARRLGEIGDPAALPLLRRAAAAKVESKGLFGMSKQAVACGAPDASEAARRIQAAAPRR
jgi:serine/threonine-protein kinase